MNKIDEKTIKVFNIDETRTTGFCYKKSCPNYPEGSLSRNKYCYQTKQEHNKDNNPICHKANDEGKVVTSNNGFCTPENRKVNVVGGEEVVDISNEDNVQLTSIEYPPEDKTEDHTR